MDKSVCHVEEKQHSLIPVSNVCLANWLSEWLLFNANSAIFLAISWQEQVYFQWDDDEVCFVIGSKMVSVLPSSAVYRGFESRSGQNKDYKIGICCFSAKHAALKRKSKDWFGRNQNNVSEWSDKSTCGLLFQWD
jgi:hypothetical protein